MQPLRDREARGGRGAAAADDPRRATGRGSAAGRGAARRAQRAHRADRARQRRASRRCTTESDEALTASCRGAAAARSGSGGRGRGVRRGEGGGRRSACGGARRRGRGADRRRPRSAGQGAAGAGAAQRRRRRDAHRAPDAADRRGGARCRGRQRKLEADDGVTAQARRAGRRAGDGRRRPKPAAVAAEEATRQAQAALERRRPKLQDGEAQLHRLESRGADAEPHPQQGGARACWPAIADELQGGGRLRDRARRGARRRSRGLGRFWSAAPLGAARSRRRAIRRCRTASSPLSQLVSGSALLQRRLDQIGLVEKAEGARLQPLLRPGQRLVSRQGDFWRWDGFVAAADAPSAAAQRLAQRNRLAELDAEIEGCGASARNALKRRRRGARRSAGAGAAVPSATSARAGARRSARSRRAGGARSRRSRR